MKTTTTALAVAATLLLSAAPSLAAPTMDRPGSSTPNSCIELNKGDWNACNVGNSGAGDKPYRAVGARAASTSDARVEIDHSAWKAYDRRGGSLPYLLAQ